MVNLENLMEGGDNDEDLVPTCRIRVNKESLWQEGEDEIFHDLIQNLVSDEKEPENDTDTLMLSRFKDSEESEEKRKRTITMEIKNDDEKTGSFNPISEQGRQDENISTDRKEARTLADLTIEECLTIINTDFKIFPEQLSAEECCELLQEKQDKRYQIVKKIGAGGQAIIICFFDKVLGKELAFKIFQKEDKESLLKNLENVRKISALDHSNILSVDDIQIKDQYLYTVMKYVRGGTLSDIILNLRRAQKGKNCAGKKKEIMEKYDLMERLQIFMQICQGMNYAHEAGKIIHCDLKPENIFVTNFGEVKIADWDICKKEGEKKEGVLAGTPLYMAPEQAYGMIDKRSDIYALGAILYELITLERVYNENLADEQSVIDFFNRLVKNELPIIPPSKRKPELELPSALDEIVLKAMNFDLRKRYQTGEEFRQAILDYIEGIKEKERRKKEAEGLIMEAKNLMETCDNFRRNLKSNCLDLDQEIKDFEGFEFPDVKTEKERDYWNNYCRIEREKIFEKEEEIKASYELIDFSFYQAVQKYRMALMVDPLNKEAKDFLKSFYLEQYFMADMTKKAEYQSLALEYGATTEDLIGYGKLSWKIQPKGAQVTIFKCQESGRKFENIKLSGLADSRVERGEYILKIEADQYETVTIPIQINEPGEEKCLEINLLPKGKIPTDFMHIPGGSFRSGEEKKQYYKNKYWTAIDIIEKMLSQGDPETQVNSFAMKKYPVTIKEYVDFLNDLLVRGRQEEALAGVPLYPGGTIDAFLKNSVDVSFIRLTETGGEGKPHFELIEIDSDGYEWKDNYPVLAVSYNQAKAYCDWKSKKEGKKYDLPTLTEWQKAGGGRIYPWGSYFDPSFCKCQESNHFKPGPEPVGTYYEDMSPYGVGDMAGGVSTWLSDLVPKYAGKEIHRIVGGSWGHSGNKDQERFKICSSVFMQGVCDQTFTTVGFRPVICLT